MTIIKYNDKFKSFRNDSLLLNYLIDNNKINKLKINYVIVNNLDIIEIKEYLNNNRKCIYFVCDKLLAITISPTMLNIGPEQPIDLFQLTVSG